MKIKKISIILLAVLSIFTVNGQQKYYDAAIFDVVGHPKYILNEEGIIAFNEDGSLNKEKSPALSSFDKYEITRDVDGYPISVVTDFETITFKYDKRHLILEKYIKGAENYTESYNRKLDYIYPSESASKWGSPYSITKKVTKHVGSIKKTTEEELSASNIDSHGNWCELWLNLEYGKDPEIEDTRGYRIIIYHGYHNKYDSSGDKEISLFEMLDKPLGLDNGGDILKMSLKDLKQTLKKSNIKYKEYANVYTLENYDKTFWGHNITPSFVYLNYTDKVTYNLELSSTSVAENEDFFGYLVSTMIEKGYKLGAGIYSGGTILGGFYLRLWIDYKYTTIFVDNNSTKMEWTYFKTIK